MVSHSCIETIVLCRKNETMAKLNVQSEGGSSVTLSPSKQTMEHRSDFHFSGGGGGAGTCLSGGGGVQGEGSPPPAGMKIKASPWGGGRSH